MGSTVGSDADSWKHIPKSFRIEDREPVELPEPELRKRLGSDVLQAIAQISADPEQALSDTAEIELGLIEKARQELDLSKGEE